MRRQLVVLCLAALAACSDRSAGPDQPGGDPPITPGPAGPLPSVGGCQVFPADNAWNRDVSGDPVHPNSSALIGQMLPDHALHLDLGTDEEYYGIPYTVVPASQPLVPIRYGTDGVDYSDESDRDRRREHGGAEPVIGRSPPAGRAPGRLHALRAVQHRA